MAGYGRTARLYFYPRSPCGERPADLLAIDTGANISIHALLAESDNAAVNANIGGIFISIHALLAESDSDPGASNRTEQQISIHALLAESDDNGYDGLSQVTVFLSTLSLRRATGASSKYMSYGWVFLSTLSLRRATNNFAQRVPVLEISIHALLAESDLYGCYGLRRPTSFLSTLSLRRAT